MTTQKIRAVFLIALLCNSGCMVTKVKKLDASRVAQPQQEHIVGVTTKNSEEVGFDPPGGRVNRDAIEAKVRSVPYSVAISDVQRLWVEQRGVSALRTIGLTVGIAAATLLTIALIAAITKYTIS